MDAPDPIEFHGGRMMLYHGDAREVLRRFEDNSVDSVCCDPPYALESIKRRFGGNKAAAAKHGKDGSFARVSRGFMGKEWDTGDTAFNPGFWAEVLRVLKPGGYAFIFGGDRTYHRLACAVEDAGFEIRRMFIWAYGSGFNKKGYIFKDEQGTPQGPWGGDVKPAIEPICCARKPLSEKTIAANVLRWGTGAVNVDGCRIGIGDDKGIWPITARRHADVTYTLAPIATDTAKGRWPANLVHDNSEEVLACFPESESTGGNNGKHTIFGRGQTREVRGGRNGFGLGDSGSAARFFASFPLTEDDKRIYYSSKADFHDRAGASHPTVKPVSLLQWLVRLITPPGGTCLDPFAGTGTTAEACFREGMRCILIEREDKYVEDIKRRMELMMCGRDERSRESIKARGLVADPGPLFGSEHV